MLDTECATNETSLLTMVVEEGTKREASTNTMACANTLAMDGAKNAPNKGPCGFFYWSLFFCLMFVNDVCQLNINKWSM